MSRSETGTNKKNRKDVMTMKYEKIIPASGYGKCNAITVSLGYNLGGMNYWTGRSEGRGYYLYAQPQERRGNMISTMVGDGFKILLKPVTRQSKKAEQEAINLAESKLQWAVNEICDRYNMTVCE